eukprot:gene50655-30554_t
MVLRRAADRARPGRQRAAGDGPHGVWGLHSDGSVDNAPWD